MMDRKQLIHSAVPWTIEILVNFLLPYLAYSWVQPHHGDVKGLLAAAVPPVLWSLVEFAWKRKVDAVAMIVILGIVLSLLAFLGGGSVKFLQLRENLVTGIVGLLFLISAAIGRPLIYQLARAHMARRSEEQAAAFTALREKQGFRRTMTLMTLVWGFGLIAQMALACALVFVMSIKAYLLVSPFVNYGGFGIMIVWTFWYAKRAQRLGGEPAGSFFPVAEIRPRADSSRSFAPQSDSRSPIDSARPFVPPQDARPGVDQARPFFPEKENPASD